MNKIFLFLLLASGAHSSWAMKGKASFFKQTLPRWTGNTLFVTGALWPAATIGTFELLRRTNYDLKECERLSNVSPSTQSWAHKRLRLNGVNNPEEYSIKCVPSYVSSYASDPYKKVILVSPDITHTSLSKLTDIYETERENRSEEDESTLQAELPIHNGAFDHEYGHIRNKDHVTGALAGIAIPILSLCAIKKWNPFKGASSFGYQLFKGPFGFGLGAVNVAAYCKVLRYSEFRADDSVHNDIETLQGGCSLFQNRLKEEKEGKEVFFKTGEILGYSSLTTKALWEFQNIYSTHPPTEKRLARVNRRLEKLQQENAAYQKDSH